MSKFIVKSFTKKKPIFKHVPPGTLLKVSEVETDKIQKIDDFVFFKEITEEVAEKLIKEVDETF